MSRRKGVCKLIVTSRGQTMTEYAPMLATISIVSATLVQDTGTILDALVNHVCTLF
jgi:hypothetical protein